MGNGPGETAQKRTILQVSLVRAQLPILGEGEDSDAKGMQVPKEAKPQWGVIS